MSLAIRDTSRRQRTISRPSLIPVTFLSFLSGNLHKPFRIAGILLFFYSAWFRISERKREGMSSPHSPLPTIQTYWTQHTTWSPQFNWCACGGNEKRGKRRCAPLLTSQPTAKSFKSQSHLVERKFKRPLFKETFVHTLLIIFII